MDTSRVEHGNRDPVSARLSCQFKDLDLGKENQEGRVRFTREGQGITIGGIGAERVWMGHHTRVGLNHPGCVTLGSEFSLGFQFPSQ